MDKLKYQETKDRVVPLVNQCIYSLLQTHAFVGYLFQSLVRTYTDKMPTAYVTIKNSRFVMGMNPYFMDPLNLTEKKAIISHEVGHLLADHLFRMRHETKKDAKLVNVAADFAVNSWVTGLPKMSLDQIRKDLKETQKLDDKQVEDLIKKSKMIVDENGMVNQCLLPSDHGLPVGLSMEEYYKLITENKELKEKFSTKTLTKSDIAKMTPEEQQQLADDIKNGKVTFSAGQGSHGEWEEIDEEDQQIVNEELKRLIREAYQKAGMNFGNIPGDLQRSILDFIKGRNNWRAIYQSFIQYATQSRRKISRKRRNRRFGITYPGRVTERTLKIAKIIDTSGSIGPEDLALVAGELNKAFETNLAKIDIITADTQVHEHYTMTKKFTATDVSFKGGGGTDAGAWIEYANKHEFDGLIVLTDGAFSYDLPKSKAMVLWCLTQNSIDLEEFKKNIPYGRVIKLETEK